MNISTVVVTFNSEATFEVCLSSLRAQQDQLEQLVVVDNHSADGTLSVVASRTATCPNVAVIENDENLGYARAANAGIAANDCDLVLLLNPDAVLGNGCIAAMKDCFKDPRVAMVGPVSNYVAGHQNLRHHLPAINLNGLTPDDIAGQLRAVRRGQTLETRLLIGFCAMIRRSSLDKVGLLDEELFLGSDDLDLCWRLRLLGYKLVIACDAYVEHIGQQSFKSLPEGESERLLAESTAAFKRKLEKFYAPNPIPPSEELFGISILPR